MTIAELRAYIRSKKDGAPCHDCEVAYPFYVMEFDHVRGEKLFSLGSVGFGSTSGQRRVERRLEVLTLELVDAELKKCDIVCANCHRARRYGGA